MKSVFKFFILNILYWLIVALWARCLFVVFYFYRVPEASSGSWYLSFIHGFRLDLSLAAYITVVAMILWMAFVYRRLSWCFWTYRVWGIIALVTYLVITIADIAVYKHWNTKINLAALQFAGHPQEVMASIGTGDHPVWWVIVFVVSLLILMVLLRIVIQNQELFVFNGWKSVLNFTLSSLFCLSLMGVMIRGGIQQNPINQSSAYYSEIPILNHASINATWNLIHKIINNRGGKNPYYFDTQEKVNQALHSFYTREHTPTTLTTIRHPNIVYIILEGFTADVISSFGGESGLTPTIDSLIHQSLICTRFYANGDRTFKGLPSILSGVPTQPSSSVTQNPDQTLTIPSMAKSMKAWGYNSSFYYGGESEFANIKAFLVHTGFDKIVDIRDFPSALRGKKWGVPDQYVFDRLAHDLNKTEQPFFASILTLSSHEPYDIPMEPLIKSNTWPDLFRNTVYYTDFSLSQFLQTASDFPWYDSTLFVLTADHGNPMPKDYPNNFHPGKFKIPLLIFGPALNVEWKGKQLDKIGAHTDLTYSILHALGVVDSNEFRYSNDLFHPGAGSAYYTFDHGFGIVNDRTRMAFDLTGNKVVFQEGPVTDSLIRLGKLLMQGTYKPE